MAVVLPVYWPVIGGCEIHTHELVTRLSARHHVRVITTISKHEDKELGGWFMLAPIAAAPDRDERYADDQAQVTKIGLPRLWKKCLRVLLRACASTKLPAWLRGWTGELFIAGYKRKLRGLIGQPDVIHAINGEIPWLSYAAMKLARELAVPFVFTAVGHIYTREQAVAGAYSEDQKVALTDVPPQLSGIFGEHFLRTSRAADIVFAMTDVEKSYFMRNGINGNVRTVGVAPVLSARPEAGVRQAYGIPQQCPLILFLGRVNPDKGVASLIAAAKLVWRKVPDARFLFVGPFEWGSASLFAAERDPRLVCTGAVSLERKTGALATCDLLCVPSAHETLGGVFLEAWAFGKPVIGAAIPPFRELTGQGAGGIAVKPTPDEISDAILLLLRDRATAERMGAWGREQVNSRFTWEAIADTIETCYREVVRA